MEGFSSLVDTAKGLWDDFTGWLFGEDEVPETNPVSTVADGMESDIPRVETAVQNTNQALSGLEFNPEAMQQKGTESMQALADGITAGTPAAQSEAQNAGQSIMDYLSIDTTGAGTSGADLMQSVTDGIISGTPGAEAAAQTAGQNIMASFNIDTTGAGSAGADLMQSVADSITSGTGTAEAAAQTAGQNIMASFNIDANGAGSAGTDLMQSVAGSIASGTGTVEAAAQTAGQETINSLQNGMDNAQDTGNKAMQNVASGMTSGSSAVTKAAQTAGKEAMNAFQTAVSSASQLGSQMMRNVSSGISSAGSGAVSTARGIASQIKGAFENMRITVPRPVLPHVNVSYSTVGSGGASASVPNFSVSYYAEGAIMKKPYMFGMNGNSPMVGGEAGEEAIVPLDSLWSRMRNVVTDIFSGLLPEKIPKETDGKKEARELQKESVTRYRSVTRNYTETGKKSTSAKDGAKTIIIQKLEMNVDASTIDSVEKLRKILLQIDGDNDPIPEGGTA